MSKKIAIISDIHGNYTALNAVYNDSQKIEVDDYWFLGDLFSPGPGAMNLWTLFKKMNPSICVRGNWDDLLIKGIEGKTDISRMSQIYIGKLAQNLSQYLTKEVIDEMKSWKICTDIQVQKTRFGLGHNLPEKNFGQKLYPTAEQKNFDIPFNTFEKCDVYIYGHVHHPIMRYSDDERMIFNPGSVGQPFFKWNKFQEEMLAEYLVLEIDEDGIRSSDFRKVFYDLREEYQRAINFELPYLELYKLQMETGKVHTHDEKLLKKYNKIYGYEKQVKGYIKNTLKKEC